MQCKIRRFAHGAAPILLLRATARVSAFSTHENRIPSSLAVKPPYAPARTHHGILPRHYYCPQQQQWHWSSSSSMCGRRHPTQLNAAAAPHYLSLLPSLHDDASFCLTMILLLSTFGITLERRTTIGKAVSAPLATMAVALVAANVGILPFASPVYATVNAHIVPMAVPLLLFDANLRRIVRDTGSLLVAFGVGAVATLVGTIGAFWILPMTASLGPSNWKVACALTARHIGGAINFVAVADTLSVPGTAVSAAIAADNVVVALYFAFLFAIAAPGDASKAAGAVSDDTVMPTVMDPESIDDNKSMAESITLSSLSMALSTASALVTVGRLLTKAMLPLGTSSLPITSVLTVIAATAWPTFFVSMRSAGTALGILGIGMFFAASGAAGSIRLVLQQAPALFAFSMLQIGIHFGFLMAVGRGLLRLPSRELYLASNANVGGPTTAAAMAQAKDWKRLVLPALLVGILGYATATGIALALGPVLVRMTKLL